MQDKVVPYKDSDKDKTTQVATMFNNISGKYDFLNHFLSMGIDKIWRKIAIKKLKKTSPSDVLDVATGTGDFAIEINRQIPDANIKGVDISEGMVSVGKTKIEKLKLGNKISLGIGDCANLEFDDESFDGVTVAFGVRNFEDLEKGLSEIYRVLRKNGTIIVLEFSKPRLFFVKSLYYFYFRRVLPFIGKLVSKDDFAYKYLPQSVNAFPCREEFTAILSKVGFKNSCYKNLTFGISAIYTGVKS